MPSKKRAERDSIVSRQQDHAHSLRGAPPREEGDTRKPFKPVESEEAAIRASEDCLSAVNIDSYGVGAPTDRLQFGYSPAVATEAIAFYSRFTTPEWTDARRENYRTTVLKRQRLTRPHFEPVETFFKLKLHWKQTAALRRRGQSSRDSAAVDDDTDDFLKLLAVHNAAVGATTGCAQMPVTPPSVPAVTEAPVGEEGPSRRFRPEQPPS